MSRAALAAALARCRPDTPARAAAWYLALTLVMTWPLAAGLARDVPSDHGDPLLNSWILAWNIEHVLRALGGELSALRTIFHANIFHPATHTLAYSELLFTQSVLALPLHAATGNILLTYNVLFLAAFVLSGLGMYLFVRALTGDWRAGFLSGLIYAFTPYRLDQAPHLQVMWSCWMPFVLLGIRRYFDARDAGEHAGRRRPAWYLAGAALALVAQSLSCGYYLLFFPPFVAIYAVYELVARGRLRDWRAWVALATTGAASAAALLPFMTPYFVLRDQGQRSRSVMEVASFSADTYAYLTAQSNLILWRWLDLYPRPEGRLFPGLVPIVLTIVGLAAALFAARRAGRAIAPDAARAGGSIRSRRDRIRHASALLLLIATIASGVALVGIFLGLEGRYNAGPVSLRLYSASRPLLYVVLGTTALLALSARARAGAAHLVREHVVWAAGVAALAAWLSLGPLPAVLGDQIRDATIYPHLYRLVPGFDALRVPARFAMIVMLGLAWASAAGYVAIARRTGTRVFPLLCALALADAASMPIPLNGRATSDAFLSPPVTIPVTAPPLQRAIADLPADAILVEMPFGDVSWEIRYVYLSTFHWRRLVNGYSGHFPPHYLLLRSVLSRLPDDEEPRAWPLLAASGATHVIVHGEALGPERTARLRAWLERHGVRLLRQVDEGYIYVR